jgi:hypothetical protein
MAAIVDAARVGGKTSLVEGYLKMEAIRSSETSVLIRATRCHFPENDNHHSHRRGNLKSYNVEYCLLENDFTTAVEIKNIGIYKYSYLIYT